jgi:zinc finger protein
MVDPSGNSFIQNPNAPLADPSLKVEHFYRSMEDYKTMGYNAEEA